MLNNLDYQDYVLEINTKFYLAETGFELELIEVTETTISPHQEMFSLIFQGVKDNFLEQGIYPLRHKKLGEGELFLVPIAEDPDGFKYEALFNRLIATS